MQYSVVNYKTIKKSHSLRIDADFFADYLDIQDKLKSKSFKKLFLAQNTFNRNMKK